MLINLCQLKISQVENALNTTDLANNTGFSGGSVVKNLPAIQET